MTLAHEGCNHPPSGALNNDRSGAHTRALRNALIVTSIFLLAEFFGGLWTNSLALLADAGHMLTDGSALGLSLFAVWFSRRPANPAKTYGYFRVEILAALVNGTALLLVALAILWEAYERFLAPQPVKSLEMTAIAVAGLIANLFCLQILHGHHHESLNLRGAFLHVLGDVLGSVAAILAGLSMWIWGFYWADPLVSTLVSLLICAGAWKLVSDAVGVLLEAAPAHVNVLAMRRELSKVPGVESIHDLHVWTLTSGLHAMTCHAVIDSPDQRGILKKMNEVSRRQFQVGHTTIQLEQEHLCRDRDSVCL